MTIACHYRSTLSCDLVAAVVSALCLAILISGTEEGCVKEVRHWRNQGPRLPTEAERCNSSQGEEAEGSAENIQTCHGTKRDIQYRDSSRFCPR